MKKHKFFKNTKTFYIFTLYEPEYYRILTREDSILDIKNFYFKYLKLIYEKQDLYDRRICELLLFYV